MDDFVTTDKSEAPAAKTIPRPVDPPAAPAPAGPAAPPKKTRRRRGIIWKILLLLLAALAVVILVKRVENMSGAPKAGGGGRRGGANGPQAVRTADAVTGAIPIVYNQLGTVTSFANVTVRTQISGELLQIGFKEGQLVKKGDFLAQIDDRPYQVTLEQAKGTLAKDQAALAQAQADLARYQTLSKQDSISHQQVDDQQYLVRQDQAAIVSDQGAIDSAKLNIAYCRIVSPVEGRVGLRQVDAGNYVQTSDTNGIVIVAQLQPISVIFTIPEDNVPTVMDRMATGAVLPVAIYDRANSVKITDGTLETVDNQVDTTTGTVKLRATFANKDNRLFPNQFVNARLLVDTLADVVVVPNAAVQQGANGAFVYKVRDDDTVAVQAIKIGPADSTDTAVISGLDAGAHVVIDGTDRLRDGMKVLVRNGAPDAAPPPPGSAGPDAAGTHRHHRHRQDGTEPDGGKRPDKESSPGNRPQ